VHDIRLWGLPPQQTGGILSFAGVGRGNEFGPSVPRPQHTGVGGVGAAPRKRIAPVVISHSALPYGFCRYAKTHPGSAKRLDKMPMSDESISIATDAVDDGAGLSRLAKAFPLTAQAIGSVADQFRGSSGRGSPSSNPNPTGG